jgi:Phosphotransferase enzyme family
MGYVGSGCPAPVGRAVRSRPTYTLDTRLPGGTAEDHDVSAVGEDDLAGLLAGLREVPVRQAEVLGAPAAVLVHHDLRGEHLDVSADGRVRGVLDWTDAVIRLSEHLQGLF